MRFENISVHNFDNAIRGMRNPKNSWSLSDSSFGICKVEEVEKIAKEIAKKWTDAEGLKDAKGKKIAFDIHKNWLLDNGIIAAGGGACQYAFIGPADMKLAQTLIRGGSEHRKFLRQITVSVDMTAPLYIWKEFDQYRINVTTNSTSTMHKITSQPITLSSFEIDDFVDIDVQPLNFIGHLEWLRVKYLETKDKRYWKELIRWLPESWLQTRTVSMNYENVFAMAHQRAHHKLNEWSGVDDSTKPHILSMFRKLPYARSFIFLDEK